HLTKEGSPRCFWSLDPAHDHRRFGRTFPDCRRATDAPRLAGYASHFQMLVLMANHAASVGTHVSVGRSAVWAPGGAALAEAANTDSSLVITTRTREGWRGEVVRL